MSDLWPWYAKVATAAEAQNAEPGDPVQKMYECVYATTAVCLMALGYPDPEPTALMNLVHPGGHVGGEDYGVVAQFLRSRPQLWPNLPTILLINPADTLAYLRSALAGGYAIQVDVKDDRNANVVSQWPAGWQGTHSVIVVADAPITIWNPWHGDKQTFTDQFFQAATLNPAGNFMVFQRDIRTGGGMASLDDLNVKVDQIIGMLSGAPGSGHSSLLWDGAHKPYLEDVRDILSRVAGATDVAAVGQKVDALAAELKALPSGIAPDTSGLSAQVNAIKADLDRIFK